MRARAGKGRTAHVMAVTSCSAQVSPRRSPTALNYGNVSRNGAMQRCRRSKGGFLLVAEWTAPHDLAAEGPRTPKLNKNRHLSQYNAQTRLQRRPRWAARCRRTCRSGPVGVRGGRGVGHVGAKPGASPAPIHPQSSAAQACKIAGRSMQGCHSEAVQG